jgi:putative oxidoreductase
MRVLGGITPIMSDRERYGWITGRVLLSLIFILSGLGKLANLGGTAGYMASAGMPATWFFLPAAILLELGGGIVLATGYGTRLGTVALLVFIVPATLIFHNFWAVTGPEHQMQMIHFMKNLAIMGGLLLVLFAPQPAP